ncbi:DUF488 domain-containing protein [Bdellovibrio bacteriovorus]|uniref:DUF488 domain-containing protein n=1 Tax=Bdellovibrio TaxID=958 RepID=UPI0035A8D102
MINIKRAYQPAEAKDGYRILVDRLWPRGVKKTALKVDEWPKEISPSPELRKAFHHEDESWSDFSKAYRKELKKKDIQDKLHEIARRGKKGRVTLVYGAHDETHNHAQILKDILEKMNH